MITTGSFNGNCKLSPPVHRKGKVKGKFRDLVSLGISLDYEYGRLIKEQSGHESVTV